MYFSSVFANPRYNLPVMAIIASIQLYQSGGSFWTAAALRVTPSVWSISIAHNIVTTSGIVYKLLSFKRMVSALRPQNDTTIYTSLSAMLIESASLYCITSIICMACYVRNSSLQRIALPVLAQVMVRQIYFLLCLILRTPLLSADDHCSALRRNLSSSGSHFSELGLREPP